jgi:mannose/cellobiose epimerase-like protein (N-acyl-D-glucosamine 2-epimerase family)
MDHKQPEKKDIDIKKLIDEAIEPDVWKKHLVNDLMKFWDTSEATDLDDGLFRTYLTNAGKKLPKNQEDWPEEYKAALNDPVTIGLVNPEYNYVRAHSRLTYAFGIAFHMTGDPHYLEVCRQGALALADAMDGNYGMHVMKNVDTGSWDEDYKLRTSQDLAYGLTGLGMYYFLTHDNTILHKIIQLKDFIFKVYLDEGKGYVTWFPKHTKDPEVQIVAQLDQLYAYMLMLTPSLPEPYQSIWKKDMKKIVDILITQFYSEHYKFFWGVESSSGSMELGSDHTDFGHSVKTFWVILKVGELLGEPFYIQFARKKIDKILKNAYIEETGSWARRFDEHGKLDTDKEWWILAELDQAAEILSIHDPSYYKYLNNTHRYWFDHMVDKEHGEIWHMVDGKTNEPVINYPKAHSWKTSLHSFEHALFGYMTASRIKDKEFDLYYALPEWERISHHNVAPYMFFGNVVKIHSEGKTEFLPDGNQIYKVTFNGLH